MYLRKSIRISCIIKTKKLPRNVGENHKNSLTPRNYRKKRLKQQYDGKISGQKGCGGTLFVPLSSTDCLTKTCMDG